MPMRLSHLLFSTLLATGGVAYTAASAAAQSPARAIPSWYLTLGASVSFVQDAHLTSQGGGASGDGNLTLDTGYGLSGAIGYRPRYTNSFWDNTRFEVELGLLDNDIESLTANGGGTISSSALNGGDIQSSRVMANMYIDFDASNSFRPYIGGGVGIARIHIENEEDTAPAYQAMAGVSYIPPQFPITEFGVGYRYFSTSNPVFTDQSDGSLDEIEYDAHILELSMRAYF